MNPALFVLIHGYTSKRSKAKLLEILFGLLLFTLLYSLKINNPYPRIIGDYRNRIIIFTIVL